MRQAGIIAAAGLYALENNIERLLEDHNNAAYLAEGLRSLMPLECHTNMLFVNVGSHGSALEAFLKSKGILIWGEETLRLVTHLDVTKEDIERVIHAFKEYYSTTL